MKARQAEKHKEELRKMTLSGGNKVCMHCPVRGPLYAVLDYGIFVCTQCSAVHRSFQHKVKGISMSGFTSEEVQALRVGGNERAALIYRSGYPHGPAREGDERAVRNVIRQCFIDRNYFNATEFNALQQAHEAILLGVAPAAPAVQIPQGSVVSGAPSMSLEGRVATTQQQQQQQQHRNPEALPSQIQPSRQPPQQQPQQMTQPAVDDFFSGGHTATVTPPAPAPPSVDDDFFADVPNQRATASAAQSQMQQATSAYGSGPQAAAHGSQRSMQGGDGGDWFGGGAGGAPKAQQLPQRTSAQATAQQQMSPQTITIDPIHVSRAQMASRETRPDDLFGSFGGTATQQRPSQQDHRHGATANDDFLLALAAAPATSGAPVAMNTANNNNRDYFGSFPISGGKSLERSDANRKSDPFASLDPLAKR